MTEQVLSKILYFEHGEVYLDYDPEFQLWQAKVFLNSDMFGEETEAVEDLMDELANLLSEHNAGNP